MPLAWLAKLGVISYSLYAVHVPVCVFVRSFFFEGTQSRNMLAIFPAMAACILFAWGLFLLVERHSLQIVRRHPKSFGLESPPKKIPVNTTDAVQISDVAGNIPLKAAASVRHPSRPDFRHLHFTQSLEPLQGGGLYGRSAPLPCTGNF